MKNLSIFCEKKKISFSVPYPGKNTFVKCPGCGLSLGIVFDKGQIELLAHGRSSESIAHHIGSSERSQ